MTSPRNPSIFSPHDALLHVILSHEGATVVDLVDALLDRDVVYTTEVMPRGFKVSLRINPVPDAIILGGLELELGQCYDLVIKTGSWRQEPKTQSLIGYTFASSRWGSAGFQKKRNGPIRYPRASEIVSIKVHEGKT